MRGGLQFASRLVQRVTSPITMAATGNTRTGFASTRSFANMPHGIVKGGKEDLTVGRATHVAPLPGLAAQSVVCERRVGECQKWQDPIGMEYVTGSSRQGDAAGNPDRTGPGEGGRRSGD